MTSQLKTTEDDGSFLEAEIRDWVEERSGYTFEDPDDWLSELDNGVVLCKMLAGIDDSLKTKFKAKPMGIWGKRDNLSVFIDVLKRELDMDSVVLFEITDLLPQENAAQGANPDNVVSCLHALAKTAFEKFGTDLPGSCKAELEIEAEKELETSEIDKIIEDAEAEPVTPVTTTEPAFDSESVKPSEKETVQDSESEAPSSIAPKPKKYRIVKGDEIDEAVGEAFKTRSTSGNDFAGARVMRIKKGQYLLLPQKKVFYMRILRGQLMVRVGGGWETFAQWLGHLKQFSATHFAKKATTNAEDPAQRTVDVEKAKEEAQPQQNAQPAIVKPQAPMTRKALSRSLSERTKPRLQTQGSMRKQATPAEGRSTTPRKATQRHATKAVARQQSQLGRHLSERPASNSMMAERKALKEGKMPHQVTTRRGQSPGRPMRTTSPLAERRSMDKSMPSPNRGAGYSGALGVGATVRSTSPRRKSAPLAEKRTTSMRIGSKKQPVVKPAPKIAPVNFPKPRTPATRRTKTSLSGTMKSTNSSVSAQHTRPSRPSLARSHSLRGGARN